jgi:hypothetical protein
MTHFSIFSSVPRSPKEYPYISVCISNLFRVCYTTHSSNLRNPMYSWSLCKQFNKLGIKIIVQSAEHFCCQNCAIQPPLCFNTGTCFTGAYCRNSLLRRCLTRCQGVSERRGTSLHGVIIPWGVHSCGLQRRAVQFGVSSGFAACFCSFLA